MGEELKIKGRIEIDSDDEGLLAVLHFIPDENGSEFDKQAVGRLIAEKKIIHGINRTELDSKIDSLFSASAEVTITVAEGNSPEQAAPAEYQWMETQIPESLKEDVARVLKNAAPPEIYRTKIEKVEQVKTIKKKGLRALGKNKEEKVTEVIKQEKKIRIEVSPEIIEAGWVESGTRIALVTAGTSGKPGKDVYGKPIQPISVNNEFWLVRGVEKKKGAFVAVDSGILRRGLNWVEVIPFKSHDWTLELSKDKNTCLLNFNPGGAESSVPDPAEIIKRAEILGCTAESLISAERISGIINTAVTARKVLNAAVISTDDDSLFEIRVAEDKLKAELVLHKGRGRGKPLVLKQVGAAIKASGLAGLDLKKIQNAILEFYRGAETDAVIPLSSGDAVEDGEAGKLVYELDFFKDTAAEDIKKRISNLSEGYLNEIKSADVFPPAEANAFAKVMKDQQIAKLDVNDGQNGKDVYGKDIVCSAADLSGYKALENVKIDGGLFSAECSGLLERFEKDGITAFRIRSHIDSELKVKLSSDRMSAAITAEPAVGTGAPPSLEEANRLLAEAGVVNGIDSEILRTVVTNCREGLSVPETVVAVGKPPKNAGDSEFKLLVELADGQAVSIDEHGKANYRKQNKFSNVNEGDKLGVITKVEGETEDGWDVCGKVLNAQKTAPLNLEIGANILEEQDENGNTILAAAKSGRLMYANNKIDVQESLYIKGDVDFSSGNIKFSGGVNVKGSVKSGFFVVAGGNVAVGMNSEMSLLSSEKSIMVGQGIKGGGKAILRAKESIQLSFAEQATLLAVDNITVKNAVFGCKVKCNGMLKLVSEKGYLIGGRIQARKGVEAANIGSIAGSRTLVSFGQDYLISDKIETEEKEINKIKARLVKIDPEMRNAERAADRKKLTQLQMEKVKMMKIMEKRVMRVFALKERFEQHFPGEVLIRGEVFPGVVFESHGRNLEITKSEKAVRIYFNQETGMVEKAPVTKKDN